MIIYKYVYIYSIVQPAEQKTRRYLKALTTKNPNLLNFVHNTPIFQYYLMNFFVEIALYIKQGQTVHKLQICRLSGFQSDS